MELGNVAHLEAFHGNSNRVAIGLRHCVAGRGVGKWKVIHHLEGGVNALNFVETGKRRLGRSSQDLAIILHFSSGLTLKQDRWS